MVFNDTRKYQLSKRYVLYKIEKYHSGANFNRCTKCKKRQQKYFLVFNDA